VKVIRLIADGCPGQNKNSTLLTAVSSWLLHKAPQEVTELELVFPVTGHSFIPPDRVFGEIEQAIKKREEIILPEEYRTIIGRHGKVLRFGEDTHECIDIYDWKTLTQKVMKPTSRYHFRIKQCKRFFIRRNKNNNNCEVRGELVYKHNMASYSVLTKKNFSLRNAEPSVIQKYEMPKVKAAKVADVSKLLSKHFGNNWDTLSAEHVDLRYYRDFLARQGGGSAFGKDDDDDCFSVCEYVEECTEFIV
jgi:DNA-binding transcriptional regulator/RsmH inhibitor MraZ